MKQNTDLTLMAMMRLYSTEEAARFYFERMRWPNGPVCPHCGNCDFGRIYNVTPNSAKKIRPGIFRCGECVRDFTVTVKTVMEDSHIPLTKWLYAFYLMCASKTQISALQLQRQLELGSYRTAWFMCHRIRFAFKSNPTSRMHGVIEADETYVGGKVRGRGRRYTGNKTPVVSLVECGGKVRSTVVPKVSGKALSRLIRENVTEDSCLNTDQSRLYTKPGKKFAAHDTVNHGIEEYARRDKKTGRLATTNTVEGFFGNAKRSLDGTHHNVSRKYLPLYLAEIDHKYNTRGESDGARTDAGIKGIDGKCLMLKTPLSGVV